MYVCTSHDILLAIYDLTVFAHWYVACRRDSFTLEILIHDFLTLRGL